jgi:hypothetical protein
MFRDATLSILIAVVTVWTTRASPAPTTDGHTAASASRPTNISKPMSTNTKNQLPIPVQCAVRDIRSGRSPKISGLSDECGKLAVYHPAAQARGLGGPGIWPRCRLILDAPNWFQLFHHAHHCCGRPWNKDRQMKLPWRSGLPFFTTVKPRRTCSPGGVFLTRFTMVIIRARRTPWKQTIKQNR